MSHKFDAMFRLIYTPLRMCRGKRDVTLQNRNWNFISNYTILDIFFSKFFCCKIAKIAQAPVHSHSIFSEYVSSVRSLSYSSLFSTGAKPCSFCPKTFAFNYWFSPLSKTLVARLVAFTAVDRFFKRLWTADETS